MTQTVADVQLHSNLIDDYLYVEDAPAAPGPPGSFVAVRQGTAGRSDLLTVDSAGKLLHFAPDSTSLSGWRVTHVQVPQPAAVTSRMFGTVSFYFGGALNAICLFNAPQSFPVMPAGFTASWMWLSSDGTWYHVGLSDAAQSMLSLCTQLDHYTDNAGNVYVYGVVPPILGQLSAAPGSYLAPKSATFFVIYFNTETKDWDVGYQCEVGSLNAKAPVTFQILSGGSGNPTILWIDPDSIQWQQASLNPSPGGFNWVGNLNTLPLGSVVINGVRQIIRFPGTSFPDGVLFLDNSQTIWLAKFLSGSDFPILIQLTGIKNAPAGATAGSLTLVGGEDGSVPLFVVEAGTSNLWISRRYAGDLPLEWTKLGNQVQAIAVPETVPAGLELFYVDLHGTVYHMSQNPGDTVWVTSKVAAPVPSSATPAPISSIAMHAAAVDANGAPVANAIFTVTSDQWVNLIVNELSHWAGPSASAIFQADELGHATAQFVASGLAMPKLTFSAVAPNSDPGDATAQRWCQGDAIEVKQNETPIPVSSSSMASRLAGKDPLHPVTETTLEKAGLLDPNFNGKSDAVNNITQIGQWMLAQNAPSTARPQLPARHWRFEFSADKKSCRELSSPPVLNPAPGSILSDIFGDAVNWAKQAAGDLTSLVISVGTSFEITFNEAVKFTVSTVREAGEVLEVVFVHIVQGIQDVITIINNIIEFLRLLFDWQDIIYTHQALRTGFNQFLTMITASLGKAENLVNSEFGCYSAQISQTFDDMVNDPLFGNSFHQYVQSIQSQTPPVARSGLDGGIYNTPYQQHFTRIHYVYHHAKSHFARNSSLSLPRLGDLSTLTASVQKNWNADGGFQGRAEAVHKQLTANGISGFFDLVIKDFLLALKELALSLLQGAKEITRVILGLLEDAVQGLQSTLNASIDIPVISYIYKLITGDDLSILDVLCLIFAVPVTILYKIIFGSAPFSSDSVNQLNNLPWPWLTADERSSEGKSVALRSQAMPPALAETLGVITGFCNLFGTFISAVCDRFAFLETAPIEVLFLSWINLIFAGLRQVYGAPWKVFLAGSWSTADKWNVALWVSNIIPFAADTIFTAATGALTEFKPMGPILNTGFGLATTVLGAATARSMSQSDGQYKGWAIANSIVSRPARFFKWCILTKGEEEAPVFMAVLVAADALFGIGSTVTQIGSAVAG